MYATDVAMYWGMYFFGGECAEFALKEGKEPKRRVGFPSLYHLSTLSPFFLPRGSIKGCMMSSEGTERQEIGQQHGHPSYSRIHSGRHPAKPPFGFGGLRCRRECDGLAFFRPGQMMLQGASKLRGVFSFFLGVAKTCRQDTAAQSIGTGCIFCISPAVLFSFLPITCIMFEVCGCGCRGFCFPFPPPCSLQILTPGE